MALLDFFRRKPKAEAASTELSLEHQQEGPKADYLGGSQGYLPPIIYVTYNGEKNFGEMGPVERPVVDHARLGLRAWDLALKSEVIHTMLDQKIRWLLGTGLSLQCEPQTEVLKSRGIDIDAEAFNKQVEALWRNMTYKTTLNDYANRATFHKIANRATMNTYVRGDVLSVLRISENNCVTVQLIDGEHVSTPVGLSTYASLTDKMVDNKIGIDYMWPNGNRVRDGVEIADTGEHVAYHVRSSIGLTWERIPARNKFNQLVAFMYYKGEYRLDDPRGIPTFCASMEGAKQLEDFTEAAVSAAVERAKIVMAVEHEKGTPDINPLQENLSKVVGVSGQLDLPRVADGEQVANTISVTTQKQAFNLPPGAKLQALESKNEIHYSEFEGARSDSIYAAGGMPPEVAKQKYSSSYSASRMATKSLQGSLDIERDDTGNQFHQNFYNLQLDVWVLSGMIQAPGYLQAFLKGDAVVLAAYRHANWLGNPVPEVDELKEVQAARLKLGTNGDHIPLGNAEKLTRDLGEGSFKANVEQFGRELTATETNGIMPVAAPGQSNDKDNDGDSKGNDGDQDKD